MDRCLLVNVSLVARLQTRNIMAKPPMQPQPPKQKPRFPGYAQAEIFRQNPVMRPMSGQMKITPDACAQKVRTPLAGIPVLCAPPAPCALAGYSRPVPTTTIRINPAPHHAIRACPPPGLRWDAMPPAPCASALECSRPKGRCASNATCAAGSTSRTPRGRWTAIDHGFRRMATSFI